jgi:hypothetical protein
VPKWLLYALAAVANFALAAWFYSNGRYIVPVVLFLASLCFVAAAAGAWVNRVE